MYYSQIFPNVTSAMDEVLLPSEVMHEKAYEADPQYRAMWNYYHGLISEVSWNKVKKDIPREKRADMAQFIKGVSK